MGKMKPGQELFQISEREEIEFYAGGIAGPMFGVLNWPKGLQPGQRVPCLIDFPGWKGDRKGKKRLLLAARLVESGWAVLRIDPPGTGYSDGNALKVTLGLYSWVIQKAMTVVSQHPAIDANRFALLGTSVGGSAAMMVANCDKRVKALVLWAPRSDYHDTVPNLYWVDDRSQVNSALRRSGLRYDFHAKTKRFRGKLFILHGNQDTIVSSDQSCRLGVGRLDPLHPTTLGIISKAGHTFSGFENELIDRTVVWLLKESGLA